MRSTHTARPQASLMLARPWLGASALADVLDTASWPRLFDPPRLLQPTAASDVWTLGAADIVEQPNGTVVYKLDVPGMSKADLKVTIKDGALTVTGERKNEHEIKDATLHHVERSHHRFTRVFRLPEQANVQQLQANCENGVLSITVPKLPEDHPDSATVNVQVQ